MARSLSECGVCASSNILELVAESCLHFPGLNGLKVEPIFVFPKIVVCADCGFVQSRLSDRELEKVRGGAGKLGISSLGAQIVNANSAPDNPLPTKRLP
jgi:hypothetical protein